jgi:hypothetical protein
VEILTTGRALKVLKAQFGEHCAFHDVPSVVSPYTRTPYFMASFIANLPTMWISLMLARRQALAVIRRGRYDLVLSDCRYDVYDAVENSLLINHQLRFHAFTLGERIAEKWLAETMRQYRGVIVPDYPEDGLSGRLSHALRYFDSSRVHYIGILSRLRRRAGQQDLDYFFSLSGPEPQRTILERAVHAQLPDLDGRIVVAGGNPDSRRSSGNGRVAWHSYLDHAQQEEMTNRARFIVTRSGYSTMMELCEVGAAQALLIPTPGQTEQEYLADYCEAKGYYHHTHQCGMKLSAEIARARGFAGFAAPWRTDESVRRFLKLACA